MLNRAKVIKSHIVVFKLRILELGTQSEYFMILLRIRNSFEILHVYICIYSLNACFLIFSKLGNTFLCYLYTAALSGSTLTRYENPS